MIVSIAPEIRVPMSEPQPSAISVDEEETSAGKSIAMTREVLEQDLIRRHFEAVYPTWP